ncbi:MAG: hypothetical protein QXZ09_04355 [Candidatus Methanomethylicaceae archaeon]
MLGDQRQNSKNKHYIFPRPLPRPRYSKDIRIDLERLLFASYFSQKEAKLTRALKLRIEPISDAFDSDQFLAKVRQDYEILFGPLLPTSFSTPDSFRKYSLLEFLLDLWALGFVFMPNSAQCRKNWRLLRNEFSCNTIGRENQTQSEIALTVKFKTKNGTYDEQTITLDTYKIADLRAHLEKEVRSQESNAEVKSKRIVNMLREDPRYITALLPAEHKENLSSDYEILIQKTRDFKFSKKIFQEYFHERLNETHFWREILREEGFSKLDDTLRELVSTNVKFLKDLLRGIRSRSSDKDNLIDNLIKKKKFYHFVTRHLLFLAFKTAEEFNAFTKEVLLAGQECGLEKSQTFIVFNPGGDYIKNVLEEIRKDPSSWEEKIALLKKKSLLGFRSAAQFRRVIQNMESLAKQFPDLPSILGLTQKYNAFSYLLNKSSKNQRFFWYLVNKPCDAKKVLLNSLVPHRKDYPVYEVIDYLADRVQSLFKSKSEPEIGNSWHDYRPWLGGKLKSWVSNFLNYLELVDEDSSKTSNTRNSPSGRTSKKNGLKQLEIIRDELDKLKSKFERDIDNLVKSHIDEIELESLKSLWQELEIVIDEFSALNKEFINELKKLQESFLKHSVSGETQHDSTPSLDQLFDRLVKLYAELRLRLNEFEQKLEFIESSKSQVASSVDTAGSKKTENGSNDRKTIVETLPERLPKMAPFVGAEKYKRFLRIQNSFLALSRGLAILFNWLKINELSRVLTEKFKNCSNADKLEEVRKNLHRLYKWHSYYPNQSHQKLLHPQLVEGFKQARRMNRIFWKSAYSRQSIKTFDTDYIESLIKNLDEVGGSVVDLQELTLKMETLLHSIQKVLSEDNKELRQRKYLVLCTELSHLIKLCRIIATLCIRACKISDLTEYEQRFNREFLNQCASYCYEGLSLLESSNTHHLLRDFFSELEGNITLVRGITEIEKLPLQIINGNQSRIGIVNKVYRDDCSKLEGKFIVFNELKDSKNSGGGKTVLEISAFDGKALKKENQQEDQKESKVKTKQFAVSESLLNWCFAVRGTKKYLKLLYFYADLLNYHKQNGQRTCYPYNALVEKFFSRYSVKPNEYPFNVDLRGPTLLAEYQVRAILDQKTGKLNFVPTSDQEPQYFISVPLTLSCKLPKGAPPDALSSYVGIDVGEYCLAFAVLNTNPGSEPGKHDNIVVEIEKAGLIASGGHRILAERTALFKRRQKDRNFGFGNYLARIRKYLINDYRNQVHFRAIQNRAKWNYEYQIAGFESVDNRIKKIYYSIRKSDKLDHLESTKKEIMDTWGCLWPKDSRLCNVVSAYLTSQICLTCRRHYFYDTCLNSYGESDQVELEVCEQFGDLILLKIRPDGDILWVHANGEIKKALSSGNTLPLWAIKRGVREYMRPPAKLFLRDRLRNARSEWLKRFAESRKVTLPKNAVKRRGNSCIFRCPFKDCNAVVDADVQASINIALRGFFDDWVRSKTPKSSDLKESEIFPQFLKFLKSLNLRPGEGYGTGAVLSNILFDRSYFTGDVHW